MPSGASCSIPDESFSRGENDSSIRGGDAFARIVSNDNGYQHLGARMAEVSVEQRFHGTVILTILHLRRLVQSNDIEAGFEAGRTMHMIGPEHEAFMRKCLALDEQLQAGEEPSEPITMQLVNELQACVLRINSADPA